MTFFPVAGRELLVASHSPWLARLRILSSLGAAILSGFFVLTAPLSNSGMGGSALFSTLSTIAFAGVFLSGVALTSDSISSERRAGTLGFLFLTELSGLDILAGKLASAWIRSSTILISLLPFLALGFFMGGVTGGDMFRMVLSLINLLWFSLVFGICVSTRCTKSGTAILLTVLGLMVVNVGFPVLAGISTQAPWPWDRAKWLNELSPAVAWGLARAPITAGYPDPFWRTLLISHAFGWALFLGAAFTLPRSLDSTGARRWLPARLTSRPRRQGSSRSFDTDNPVILLCRPHRWFSLLVTLTGFVPPALLLIVAIADRSRSQSETVAMVGVYLLTFAGLILKVLYAWHCCEAFTGLREFGIEPILGTGLPERSIPDGVFRAGRRIFLPASLALGVGAVGACLLVIVSGKEDLQIIWAMGFTLYSILLFALDFQTIGWMSARSSLMKPGVMSPFSRTVLFVLGIRMFLFCVPDLLVTFVLFIWSRDRFLPWLRTHSQNGAGALQASR